MIDLLVLSASFWLAFLFRFEFSIPLQFTKLAFFTWPYVVGFQYAVLAVFNVPRLSWRYINMRDAHTIVSAIAAATLVLLVVRLGLSEMKGYTRFVKLPIGILAMNFLIASVGAIGVRTIRRMIAERRDRRRRDDGTPRVRTLLVGAGEAGVMVAREVASRPDLGIHPVGFLDDDELKIGTQINGLPVLGAIKDVGRIAEQKEAVNVLITIANAPGRDIRRITLACHDAGLHTKIIPGIYEIVGGQVNLSRIRDVAIEDLLGREPVNLDDDAIAGLVRDRVILVTGAGGSIGSELCRQVARFGPRRLVLVEKNETALFYIHEELRRSFERDEALVPCLADVCDRTRMTQLFDEHRPYAVLHAAAYKHVPMLEWNPGEAFKNNVEGTRLLAELADSHRVARFVMISTDKAVNPTSIMGASKRVAEVLVQSMSQRSSTCFVAVRFGNVLGSAGSVVPIFKEQIARGGPVTVTHEEMVRYFMTIPEASQLVLQAGAMGKGGEIFILDMGDPVRIVDLAHDLIRLSGFEPGHDMEVVFSGIRPGEKLFEELHVDVEKADKTRHPKIYVGRIAPHDWRQVTTAVDDLLRAAEAPDPVAGIVAGLAVLVPEYRGSVTETSQAKAV